MKVHPEFYSQLLREPSLSLGAFKLWHYLRDRCGEKNHCWPSQRTIAKDIHVTIKSIKGWTQELVNLGLVATYHEGQRHHTVYILTMPGSRVGEKLTAGVETPIAGCGENTHLIDTNRIETTKLKTCSEREQTSLWLRRMREAVEAVPCALGK